MDQYYTTKWMCIRRRSPCSTRGWRTAVPRALVNACVRIHTLPDTDAPHADYSRPLADATAEQSTQQFVRDDVTDILLNEQTTHSRDDSQTADPDTAYLLRHADLLRAILLAARAADPTISTPSPKQQNCIPYASLVVCLVITLCSVMCVFIAAACLIIRRRRSAVYMTGSSGLGSLPATLCRPYQGFMNHDHGTL
jgi:hypothetical protein